MTREIPTLVSRTGDNVNFKEARFLDANDLVNFEAAYRLDCDDLWPCDRLYMVRDIACLLKTMRAYQSEMSAIVERCNSLDSVKLHKALERIVYSVEQYVDAGGERPCTEDCLKQAREALVVKP